MGGIAVNSSGRLTQGYIGILLCSSKNDTVVKMALPEDNKTIMASRYELYIPSSAQLAEEVGQIRKKLKKKERE